MDVLEFLGAGLVLILVAYVVLRRALNITIASWITQLPQIVGQATQAIQVPKIKLMDAIGYGAMQILSDPSVKQAISGAISNALSGFGGQKGPPPGGIPPG